MTLVFAAAVARDAFTLDVSISAAAGEVVAVLGRVVVVVRVVVVFGVVVFVDAARVVAVAAGTSDRVGCAVVSPFAS